MIRFKVQVNDTRVLLCQLSYCRKRNDFIKSVPGDGKIDIYIKERFSIVYFCSSRHGSIVYLF
jgi:hypothetical protein